MKAQVGVVKIDKPVYPKESPYHPSENYPEYPFKGHVSLDSNFVYEGVRQLFLLMGFDANNQESAKWNPLRHIIKPGMTVVINPNFLLDRHEMNKDIFSIITHPSVIRAAGDYVWIALEGKGKIIIADAPNYNCNFDELLKITKLNEVIDFWTKFKSCEVKIIDLRNYWSRGKHFASMLIPLKGDPNGCIIVNLGKKSALFEKANQSMLYGCVYHRKETIRHHSGERQEYEVSRTVLNADVVITLPKLKVHKKVGVTLNIKGLVGIATNKNFLVHYTLKPPEKGGDQHPDDLFDPIEGFLIKLERWMYDHLLAPKIRILEYIHRSIYWLHNHFTKKLGIMVTEDKRMIDYGNWYGNDSAWRMAADLAKVFLFADEKGELHNNPQRKVFSVVDGIIGGENNGPVTPDPKHLGILLAGENLLATDIVATRLMGFDPLKIKIIKSLLSDLDFDFGLRNIDEIEILSEIEEYCNCLIDKNNKLLNFKPAPGWVGHIEV